MIQKSITTTTKHSKQSYEVCLITDEMIVWFVWFFSFISYFLYSKTGLFISVNSTMTEKKNKVFLNFLLTYNTNLDRYHWNSLSITIKHNNPIKLFYFIAQNLVTMPCRWQFGGSNLTFLLVSSSGTYIFLHSSNINVVKIEMKYRPTSNILIGSFYKTTVLFRTYKDCILELEFEWKKNHGKNLLQTWTFTYLLWYLILNKSNKY